MDRVHCGTVAAWASAWLGGTAAFDDVLSAAVATPPVAVASPVGAGPLPLEAGRSVPLGEVLIAWRQARAIPRLILPVPGDVRGVPGPPPFKAAALAAGQAVVGGGVGLVPVVIDRRPSSAPATLVWQRYEIEAPPPDFIALSDAQHDLTEAIRESATALVAAQVAGSATVGPGLSDARRAGERVDLPPGFPPRAVALVAQAERLAAVLELAGIGPAELDSADRAAADRARTLAPLVTSVRRARLAGYNATAEQPVG